MNQSYNINNSLGSSLQHHRLHPFGIPAVGTKGAADVDLDPRDEANIGEQPGGGNRGKMS